VDSPPKQIAEMLDGLYKEVVEMHHHREIWRFFNEELPKRGGDTVHQALTRWYVDTQAAAIRRIAGVRSQDKRSMTRLLKIIQKDLASVQAGTITVESIEKDLASLKAETATITRWADESVAHMGRKQSTNPTFAQLDEAIDLVGAVLKEYYLLVTGGYLATVEPVIQDDWRGPFRSSWL
jgi:hypothetical protein